MNRLRPKPHTRILAGTITIGLLSPPPSAVAQTPGASNGPSNGTATATVPPPRQSPYFTSNGLPYTRNERHAVRMANTLQSRQLGAHRGVDGSVSYVFGEATPVIVCAPLRICALALEPGESVKDVLIGDSARWTVAPAVSGSGDAIRTYAVIKTQDVGIATNLIITTDRRIYQLTLKSAKRDHMPLISFIYPQNAQSAWAALREQKQTAEQNKQALKAAEQRNAIPGIGMRIEDLNFNYSIRGNAAWKPQRVFDDGVRTYIELPPQAVSSEAPIVLMPRHGENEMVNYRLHNNRYVVDRLAPSLVMLSGKGSGQERIHIEAVSSRHHPALGTDVLHGAN